jgi:uncharacterized SAM-binding protein YcdF (DUF218 family)
LTNRLTSAAIRLLRGYLMAVGALVTLIAVWLLSPLPLVIEDGLVVNERPVRADAIVCLSAGSVQGLPSSTGWRRIATAVRLYKEGFAPLVVFSGGTGSGGRPEAQIYAESAAVLGLPEDAVRLEAFSENTAEHPVRVAELPDIRARGGPGASLLIVTSPYHGRRVKAVFRKAGFTDFRVVTAWGGRSGPIPSRPPRTLEVGQKGIDRLYRFITATREWAALAYYRAQGWI